jgi:photosystem II stability/assembly factor-like uncharacterized protein
MQMKKNILALLCSLPLAAATAQNGWNTLSTGTSLSLLAVQALAADTVFIVGDDGLLLKSFNGGGTFTSFQDTSQMIYTALHFRTADTGLVASGTGVIRRTTNGGQTFLNSGNCTCLITSICFSGSQVGLYSGLNGLYRSTDGGASFGSTPLLITAIPVGLVSPAPGIFIGHKSSVIRKSTDYGLTFSRDTIHTASNYPIVSTTFFNTQQAYAMTADGYQYYSGDQGSTWTQVNNAPLTNIQTMKFLDSLTGYLIEGPLRNHIYKTVNGGQTWSLDYTSTSAMESISTKGNVVYICGQLGLALKNDSYTGISENAENQSATLYPNPVSSNTDEITLQLPHNTGGTYTITDLTGRVVQAGMLAGRSTHISTATLVSGMYLVHTGTTQNAALKLIRQ